MWSTTGVTLAEEAGNQKEPCLAAVAQALTNKASRESSTAFDDRINERIGGRRERWNGAENGRNLVGLARSMDHRCEQR